MHQIVLNPQERGLCLRIKFFVSTLYYEHYAKQLNVVLFLPCAISKAQLQFTTDVFNTGIRLNKTSSGSHLRQHAGLDVQRLGRLVLRN